MKKRFTHFGWWLVALGVAALGYALAKISQWSGDAADRLQEWMES